MPTDRLRIASYNVENLFSRPRAMKAGAPAATEILDAHAKVNALFEHEVYSTADKADIIEHLKVLDLLRNDGNPDTGFALLRRIRGKLLDRPRGGDVTVAADGRSDWVGWVDLTTDRIDAVAIENTARVFTEVAADIVGVVEAEDRATLHRFSDSLIRDTQGTPSYRHVMLIDGNDTRGIDVGVLSTDDYPLQSIRSHVDDDQDGNPVFSRDCPEYGFVFPEGSGLAGKPLVVLVNHFKSKGFGAQADNDKRRRRQATRVAEIYRRLRENNIDHIAVLGDFNDTPDSAPLQPLL
ncbi:endonuclease/exonuclease/phosphatase family protein, partial [Rhodococcus olei]|uniref:endonuclease/exonuclease/phosphatase family protein n=1 Tax=Rhodococcus olei TaxID=2161675 RepID=UPI0031F081F8